MYIKRNASGGVEEIIINEAKQLQPAGNISMNPRNNSTGLDAQMSDGWIKSRIAVMRNSQNPEIRNLGNLLFANEDKLTKTVTAVDRNSGEIVILKLDKY